jgi:hypothetical protein
MYGVMYSGYKGGNLLMFRWLICDEKLLAMRAWVFM